MKKGISVFRHKWRQWCSCLPRSRGAIGKSIVDAAWVLGPDPGAEACIDAGIDWILEAQRQSSSRDGGAARHFDLHTGWGASYPETTGYIIPTLLHHAKRREDGAVLRRSAKTMLDWLVSIQMPSGAFHGSHRDSVAFEPVVFDTGQILFGLAAGVKEFGEGYVEGLRSACNWLVSVQDPDGAWRVPNPFAIEGDHVWEAHVAWGLLEAAQVLGDERIGEAGMKNIYWAASKQHRNGWYPDCGLGRGDKLAPLTHTIGYTLRGILEGYLYSRDADLLKAATTTAEALMEAQRVDGSLPGQMDEHWNRTVSWACLTGCSQIALCWLLLGRETGREDFLEAARRANEYVRRTVLPEGQAEVRGGVKGSHPVFHRYCRFQYINWACKFLIDSCTLEQELDRERTGDSTDLQVEETTTLPVVAFSEESQTDDAASPGSKARHTKKLLHGSFFNVIDLGVKVAVTMVLTPMMVSGLGLSGYGLWLLVMSMANYCSLLDLGITFSASRFAAAAIGSGNRWKERLVLKVAGGYFRRIAWIIVIAAPIIALGVALWVDTPHLGRVEIALAIVLASMAMRFSLRLPLVRLRGAVRHDLIALSSITRSLLQVFAMYWVLAFYPNVINVALVQAGGEFLELMLLGWFSRTKEMVTGGSAQPAPSVSETAKTKREMKRFAGSISVIMVGEALRMQANPMIVSFHRGLEAVPVYSIGMRLLTMLQDVVGALFGSTVLSVFSQMHGAGDAADLRSTFLRYSEWAAGFSICCVVGCTWLAPVFFHRWVGPDLEIASQVMLISAVPYVFHFAQYPAHNLLYSIGRAEPLARLYLFGGATSVLMSFSFGAIWGVNGVVAGIALEMLVTRLVFIPRFVAQAVRISALRYLFGHLCWPVLKTGAAPAICAWLLNDYLLPEYGRIAWIGALYAAVSAASFLAFAIRPKDRLSFWQLWKARVEA